MDILELNKAFNDYTFNEKEHYYTYKGNRVKTSVTQFVSTKYKPFDENISKYVAKRDGKTQAQVLLEWDEAKEIACEVGTLFHLRSEQLANNKNIEVDYSSLHERDKILEFKVRQRLNKLIPLQDKFFKDIHNKLIPIKTEFTVGLEDVIAGNIDLLAWNEEEKEFQIWDYKTNKDIKLNNPYENLLEEFNNFPNCEYTKYSIQLGIYKELIERKLNINIGNCYIVWFNENNEDYKIYKCLNLKPQINEALENLKRKE